MIVCVCNALKEKDLKKCCNEKSKLDSCTLIESMGCKVNCGKCLDYIDNFILPTDLEYTEMDILR